MADDRCFPAVICDTSTWVLIPTNWSGRYSDARQWADAEAAHRWDLWLRQPGGAGPGPNAVERTALQLKSYADKYGGGRSRRPGEDLTYLYLPDPAGFAFLVHVGVDATPGLTVETAMAEPEAAEATGVEEFTTEKLGTGRKFKLQGALDDGLGEFVTVGYIFNVPDHPGVVLV